MKRRIILCTFYSLLFICMLLLLTSCGNSNNAIVVFPHDIMLGMSADKVHSILGEPDGVWHSTPNISGETFYVTSYDRPDHFDPDKVIKNEGRDEIHITFKSTGRTKKVVAMQYYIPVDENLDPHSSDMDQINSVVETYANYLTRYYGDYNYQVYYGYDINYEWELTVNGKKTYISLYGPVPYTEDFFIMYEIFTSVK